MNPAQMEFSLNPKASEKQFPVCKAFFIVVCVLSVSFCKASAADAIEANARVMEVFVRNQAEQAAERVKSNLMVKADSSVDQVFLSFLKEQDISSVSDVGKAIREKFDQNPTVTNLTQLITHMKKAGVPVNLIGKAITDAQSAVAKGDTNTGGVGAVVAAADPSLKKLQDDFQGVKNRLNLLIKDETLQGFNFGIGLSLTMDIGEHDRVKSAELDVDRRIRVKDEKNDIPRFVLESHYFFTPDHWFLGVEPGNWGHGPFVCVQPGDNIIDAVGAGWMIGFKRKKVTGSLIEPGSFNLGIGVIVDPSVQVLGDGQREGQQLGATDSIRYKNTSQTGIVGVFSVVF